MPLFDSNNHSMKYGVLASWLHVEAFQEESLHLKGDQVSGNGDFEGSATYPSHHRTSE